MASDALPSSKLGTLQHWDSVYEREVRNYDEMGDEGEVWFGEDSVERIVGFLERVAENDIDDLDASSNPTPLSLAKEPSVLDVGTGNGHLLFALLDMETALSPPTNLLGIDYSSSSVELCKRIAKTRGGEAEQILFKQVDFLTQYDDLLQSEKTQKGWDIVCDKGTLDAIALSSSKTEPLIEPVSQYVTSIAAITHRDSLFLLTSCNFTEQELIDRFSQHFTVFYIVPVPSFSFGGQKGSTTVTIAFRRK